MKSLRIFFLIDISGINGFGSSFPIILVKNKLVISEAYVNQGVIAKRVACGSKGSPRKIEKKSSHITIRVSEIKGI